jgi:predicted RNase H-like HicB family nuclease
MTVRVLYHHEKEGWWAESPDLAGWTAAGATFEEVRELVEELPMVLEDPALELEHFSPVES